ncbi:MAG: helix-turn-helix transcriptional regulator [Clostridia bacterium]|jgi:transcriptional regulator with XRE-family HTH domain|nr:MAG TPA: helix-turn-helix domain protein [Caudoviricetes sp.]
MNRLKKLRLEKNESLESISKILNVTLQTISNYENGKREMTPNTIIKLAEYFNVSTDYLLGKSDIRNPEELKNTKFANNGGLDTSGLDKEDLLELQQQIDFIKWKKQKEDKKNEDK